MEAEWRPRQQNAGLGAMRCMAACRSSPDSCASRACRAFHASCASAACPANPGPPAHPTAPVSSAAALLPRVPRLPRLPRLPRCVPSPPPASLRLLCSLLLFCRVLPCSAPSSLACPAPGFCLPACPLPCVVVPCSAFLFALLDRLAQDVFFPKLCSSQLDVCCSAPLARLQPCFCCCYSAHLSQKVGRALGVCRMPDKQPHAK